MLEASGDCDRSLCRRTGCRGVPDSADAFSIVSRLDHPTSGILMLAIGCQGSPSANWLQVQFASRLVDKKYICLCEGLSLGNVGATGSVSVPLYADEARGCTVADPKLGRESLTKYKILARYVGSSSKELMLLEVKPVTGRTHQIRVHMAHLGRPLVGDLTYGPKETSILPCERLFLHCRRFCLRDFSEEKFVPLRLCHPSCERSWRNWNFMNLFYPCLAAMTAWKGQKAR